MIVDPPAGRIYLRRHFYFGTLPTRIIGMKDLGPDILLLPVSLFLPSLCKLRPVFDQVTATDHFFIISLAFAPEIETLIIDCGKVVRRRLQRFRPAGFRFLLHAKVQKTEGPVIEHVRSVPCSKFCPLVFLMTDLCVNIQQLLLDLCEAIRLLSQARVQNALHCFRDCNLACQNIGGLILSSLTSQFPQALRGIHFQHCKSPRIDIHPGFRCTALRLLLRTVFRCASAGALPVTQPGLRLREPEVRDLRVPVLCQQQIPGLHVLMDEIILMGILKPSRRLNGNVQDPLLYLFLRPLIQGSVADAVFEAAAIHPFREDRRNASDIANIVTVDDIRMQAQIDPVLAFLDEFLFALPAPFREKLRLGALHGKIGVPRLMVHSPHAAHTAVDRIRDNFIRTKYLVALPYLLIGDRIHPGALPETALRVFHGRTEHGQFFKNTVF